MARTRKAPPDRFTAGELAIAAGLTSRNFGLLDEKRLLPPADEGGGKGKSRSWRTNGVARSALIGAFYQGGIDLLLSARLASAIADEFEEIYGQIPSNIMSVVRQNCADNRFPWHEKDDAREINARISDDFWLHFYLRESSSFYSPGTAVNGDTLIEIADRKYVFVNTLSDVRYYSPVGGSTVTSPSLRIVEWEKGADAIVRNISDELDNFDFRSDPSSRKKYKSIQEEFLKAWSNAIALLRINISLSFRVAMETIYEHRKSQESPIE